MRGVPQWVKGSASRQAHVGLPSGTVEDEHGRSGFFGPASHLYRLHPPTSWRSVDGPAAHRAFELHRVTEPDGANRGRWPAWVAANGDVSIGYQVLGPSRPEGEFLRDADGDLLFFVHRGHGTLGTEYGPLTYRPGDYLLVPRGTTFRFEPDLGGSPAGEPTHLLAVEAANSAFELPERGMLGRHALFDPALIEVPEPAPIDESGEFRVLVKRGGHDTVVTYDFHPFDVVGWKGDVAPMRLHVEDFRPVVSPRYHLPPSAHTTFLAAGFVVCTFAPRPMETDPDALRLPFFHRNVDFDEVIFYHSGEFFSRAGIGEGMLTFHPSGLHHGPQPQAVARDVEAAAAALADPSLPPRMAKEVAVMIDTRRPLIVAEAASAWELDGYVGSWSVPRDGQRP